MISEHIGRLGKSMIVYGVGGMLSRLLSFLLLPVLTYHLSPADYGISTMLSLLSFVAAPVFSLGFGAAMGICYFDGESHRRKEETVWSTFTVLIVSAAVLAGLAFMVPGLISDLLFGTPMHAYLVTVVMLSTCATILAQPFSQYLQFEQRAATFVILTGISALATATLTIGLVVILRRGVAGFVEATCLGQLVGLALFMLPAIRTLRFRLRRRIAVQMLRIGLPLMPSFIFLFMIQQANRYILQWFDGLDSVGVYAVGFNLGVAMSLLVSGFQNAWYPFFMSYIHKQDMAALLFGRIFTYYVLGFGVVSLLFYALARPTVLVMTQESFHDAYKVVGPTSSAQFFSGIFSLLLPGTYFAKDVRVLAIVQALAAVVAVVLNIWLVPMLGLIGAAIGLALGAAALAGLQALWNILRRREYLSIQYEHRRVGWFFVLYLVMAIVTLIDRDFALTSEVTLTLALIVLLAGIIYALLSSDERATLATLLSQFGVGRYQQRQSPRT